MVAQPGPPARRWLLLLAAAAALAGCRVTGRFTCETDEQCRQGPVRGACAAGSCALPDEGCVSSWRYADSADEDLRGRCLEDEPPADCAAWAPRELAPCALPAPIGPLRLAGAVFTYDTDTGDLSGGLVASPASIVQVQADGTPVRVASVDSFIVEPGVAVRLIGSLPLIVAAWGDVAIHGMIDASSATGGISGPGADPASCLAAPAERGEDAVVTGGSGGGGGGGFQGVGGRGGPGDSTVNRLGGAPGAASLPTSVRGGCSGAPSGAAGPGATPPSTETTVAFGGAGGGALQLTARGALVLGATAVIVAGGAGGGGAPMGSECGGGGGGAGGLIGLEAASISLGGIIVANGGGGGGGALRTSYGGSGGSGVVGAGRASGGSAGSTCATSGGAGGAQGTLAGADVTGAVVCGGGGGGGGAGFIRIRTPLLTPGTAVVSPALTLDPS